MTTPSDHQPPDLAQGIAQLQEIYQVPDELLAGLLGEAPFTALTQNNYDFITLGDMLKIAEAFGLVFVMHLQSREVPPAQSEENDE